MAGAGEGGEGPSPEELLEAQEFDALIGKTPAQILADGQQALFARLVSKVRAGTSTHQQEAILRNLLRDNGLTLGLPQTRPASNQDYAPLPDFEDGEA